MRSTGQRAERRARGARAQFRRGAKGKNRFDDAMGEAREALTGLTMAEAFEYVDAARCELVRRELDRVVGALANRRGG